jgi:hypothetical protein
MARMHHRRRALASAGRRLAPVAVAAAVLVPAGGGAAGTNSGKPLVFGVHGTITRIAADGTRVALAVLVGKGSCDRIVTWNATTGGFTRTKAGTHCPGTETAVQPGIVEVALGNNRLVWIEQAGGNLLDTTVEMARIDQAKPITLAFAENGNGAGGPDDSGGHLADVYGDGTLIAYDGWHVCTELLPGSDPGAVVSACSATSTTGSEVPEYSKQTLWRLVNGHRGVVRTGTTAVRLVAVDAGRLAVVHGDAATVYTAGGAPIRSFSISGPPPTHGALSGHLLALSAPGALAVYDLATGAVRRTIAIPRAEVLRDLQGTTAVLVAGRRVHAVDVLTGKGFAFTAPGAAPVDAQIESSGLFYSYELPRNRAAVAFRPLAWVATRLR